IANKGDFVEQYMFEKITTKDGDVIYEHEPEPVEVFSPQTAYLTYDILRDVLSRGTSQYVPTQLNNKNVDWIGKTGTSSDHINAWYIGSNPNVTMGSWIGYETESSINNCSNCSLSYHQRNMKLWGEIINAMAEIDSDLITPSERQKQPDGIVQRSYCAISGLIPT